MNECGRQTHIVLCGLTLGAHYVHYEYEWYAGYSREKQKKDSTYPSSAHEATIPIYTVNTPLKIPFSISFRPSIISCIPLALEE